MLAYRTISILHSNLPYPILKLWASSDKTVSLTKKLALGQDYIKYYKSLKDMQNWPKNKIYNFQLQKLKKLLVHSYKNVPYYKELFDKNNIHPKDIKKLEDLQKIPITTKEDLLKNFNKFFDKTKKYNFKYYRETAGTSGKAMKFYLDKNCIAANLACEQYFKKMMGCILGKDIVIHIPLANQFVYFVKNARLRFGHFTPLTNQVIFPLDHVDEEAFRKYIYYIKKFNIKHIEGYPSILFVFARYLKKQDISLNIKVAVSGSEMLYNFQRKFIEQVLGCEVFNKYASAESTLRGYECHEHKGIHLPPFGIAEINNNGFEGKGELVTTNLINYIFPLIRYCTKDQVSLTQKKCRCARPFPRILEVHGRTNDFITLPNGNHIHSSALFWFTVNIPGIDDIYFLQDKDYNLEVFVVKDKNHDSRKITEIIKNRIKKLSKNNLKFRIIFKNSIDRKSTKLKIVESNVSTSSNQLK
jgi:phenylacetate-CoA ligase